MIKKYRNKPIQIEAIQFMGNNIEEIEDFIGMQVLRYTNKGNEDTDYSIGVPTLGGIMKAYIGDYIVKGVTGELYPYQSDIFKQTYDEI